ncbi:NUDIX domain protein [compost metagenome]
MFVFHNLYNSWAWTGGHSDGDNDLLNVAIKEAKEETGIKTIKPISNDIFSMEILPVWGHVKKGKFVPSHQHLNLTYILEADENEVLQIKEDENSDVKWIPINEIDDYSKENNMKRYYKKIIEKFKNL